MTRVFITAYQSISALGIGNQEIIKNLETSQQTAYLPTVEDIFKKPTFPLKKLPQIEGNMTVCSKIALQLLAMTEPDWLPLSPIPLFMGTSTGGIRETEAVYLELVSKDKKFNLHDHHYFYDLAASIRSQYQDKITDCYTFATACSSTGHSIYHAYRYIQNGIINRALVLGSDSLSITTMFGFDSLKLISPNGTRPLTQSRDGLSLGEGGAVLLLESNPQTEPIAEMVAVSSNSDGYHLTAPNPQGTQQKLCIAKALIQAQLHPDQIDYINAHGTGTPTNDEIEMSVIRSIFKKPLPVTSLKGFIGHTVGSSAIIEVAIILEMLRKKKIYQPLFMNDPIDENYIPKKTFDTNINYFLKNSFGFGGNNISLIIKNLTH